MKVLKIYNDFIDDKTLNFVTDVLKNGGLIVYPTDTLYAIGCDALNSNAIGRICKLKEINPDKQFLSIVCDGISMAAEYAKFGNTGFKMLKRNIPGPFTFIFPALSSLPKVFKGRRTVGVRIPDCKVARALAHSLGNPLLSTTITYTDDDDATNPDLIADAYCNSVDCLVDAGNGGLIPSTIVDCTDSIRIVRDGKGELDW